MLLFTHGRPLLLSVCVLLSCLGISAARGDPVAEFTSAEASILEGNTTLTVWVSISEPPGFFSSVRFTSEDGTATMGFDYQGLSGPLQYQSGESADKPIVLTIFDDDSDEGPETFKVKLEPNPGTPIQVGTASEIEITIVDSDSGPAAYFVVDSDVPLNSSGELPLMSETGGEVELTVELAEFPQQPVTIELELDSSPTPLSLLFDGVQRQTLTLEAPATGIGEAWVSEGVQLLSPAPKQASSAPKARIISVNLEEWGPCFVCNVQYFGNISRTLSCNSIPACDDTAPCEDKRSATTPETDVALLARYRDEVLAAAPSGPNLIQLYQDLSPQVAAAVLKRPTFVFQVLEAQRRWMPALEAQVEGMGDSFIVTAGMRQILQDVLEVLIEEGSPEVAGALTLLAERLELETIGNGTMSAFQERSDDVSVGVVRESWGSLKRLFENR